TARTGRADGHFGTSGPQARWAGRHEGPLQAGVQGLEAPQPAAFPPNRGPDLAGAHHLPDEAEDPGGDRPQPSALRCHLGSSGPAESADYRADAGPGERAFPPPCCSVRSRLFPEI
ncbi:unnamed protein product, partial [Rangifer tarandus platyrhynchus]